MKHLNFFTVFCLLFLSISLCTQERNTRPCLNLVLIDGTRLSLPKDLALEIFVLPAYYSDPQNDPSMHTRTSSLLPEFIVSSTMESIYKLFGLFINILNNGNATLKKMKSYYKKTMSSEVQHNLKIQQTVLFYEMVSNISTNRLQTWCKQYSKHIELFTKNINCKHIDEIICSWYFFIRFLVPVVYFDSLMFNTFNAYKTISITEFENDKNQFSKIGEGSSALCFIVKINENEAQKYPIKSPIFKYIISTHKSMTAPLKINIEECITVKRMTCNSKIQFSSLSCVVLESPTALNHIGFLTEYEAYGDLMQFCKKYNSCLFSRYFIEQLFCLAKAINHLHQFSAYHLDIKINNIFVRKKSNSGKDTSHDSNIPVKKSDNSSEILNDYELLLGDFGAAEMFSKNPISHDSYIKFARSHAPEKFVSTYTNNPTGSHTDWYGVGKTLLCVANILSGNGKVQFINMFHALIDGLTVTNPELRWRYFEIESYFTELLSGFADNVVCISFPRYFIMTVTNNDESNDCNGLRKRQKLSHPNDLGSCSTEKCRVTYFKPLHSTFQIQYKSSTAGIATRDFYVEQPEIFIFSKDFPFDVKLLFSSTERKFFHKWSILVLYKNIRYSLVIYDGLMQENSSVKEEMQGKGTEIVAKINEIQPSTLVQLI